MESARNLISLFLMVLCLNKQVTSHYIPKLVTFWGQNRANAVLDSVEMNLASLCSHRSPYSTIVVGYVSRYIDHRNEDFLPGMGFSVHCGRSQDAGHVSFLYCPLIGRDIRYCQQRGKKILIGIGGPGSPAKFESAQGAERFAKLIWNLFLGGDETNDLRPFGSAILNGINFFMQNNDPQHSNIFLLTLDQLRQMDLSRRYLLTISPSCMFPDPFFGPGGHKILDISTRIIDEIYVRFTESACCMKGSLGFRESLTRWKNFVIRANRPKLYIGVPAALQATRTPSCFRTPSEMIVVYNSLKTNPDFRGFAVIDNSFDLQDLNEGFLFSKPLLSLIRKLQPHYHNHYFGHREPPRYPGNAPVIIPIKVPVQVPVPVPVPYPVVQTTLRPVVSIITRPIQTTMWPKPTEQITEPTEQITEPTPPNPTEPITIASTVNPNNDYELDTDQLEEDEDDEDENNEDDDYNNEVVYKTTTTTAPQLSVDDVHNLPINDSSEESLQNSEEILDDDDDEDADVDADEDTDEDIDEEPEDNGKQSTVFDQDAESEDKPTKRPHLHLPNQQNMILRKKGTQRTWNHQHSILPFQPFYKHVSIKPLKTLSRDSVRKDKKQINHRNKSYFAKKLHSLNTKKINKYFAEHSLHNLYNIVTKPKKRENNKKEWKSESAMFLTKNNSILQPIRYKYKPSSKNKSKYSILPKEDESPQSKYSILPKEDESKIDIIFDSPTKKDAVSGKVIEGPKINIVIDVPEKKSKFTDTVKNYGVSIKTTCGVADCNEFIDPAYFNQNKDDVFVSTGDLDDLKRNINIRKSSQIKLPLNPMDELEEEYVESLLGRYAEDSNSDEISEEDIDLMSKNNIEQGIKRYTMTNDVIHNFHDVPNVIHDEDQASIKRQMEFQIPNVANPLNAAGGLQMTLSDQMKENQKYLKLLQEDFQKQVDHFNNEIVKEQPVKPSEVNQNVTFPYNIKISELEKLINTDVDISKLHVRDLVSNVNVKGNMDHLKMLMNAMQKDIDNANNAIHEREKNVNVKQTDKNNDKNLPKNFF